VMIGISDLPHMEPRKFDLEQWQKGLRV